jgi:hypothetical protein
LKISAEIMMEKMISSLTDEELLLFDHKSRHEVYQLIKDGPWRELYTSIPKWLKNTASWKNILCDEDNAKLLKWNRLYLLKKTLNPGYTYAQLHKEAFLKELTDDYDEVYLVLLSLEEKNYKGHLDLISNYSIDGIHDLIIWSRLYITAGNNKFENYYYAMTIEFGVAFKEYFKFLYNISRDLPGVPKETLDDYLYVKKWNEDPILHNAVEIPISMPNKRMPMKIIKLLSNEELKLFCELQKQGMDQIQAYKEMREKFPLLKHCEPGL